MTEAVEIPASLLPPSATRQEIDIELAVKRLAELAVPIPELWRPADCPPELLPWLAWALSIDYWRSEWDTTYKRQVIAESVMVHRRKGTVWALKHILAAVGYPDTEVVEWWQADPDHLFIDQPAHTFCLRVYFTPVESPRLLDAAGYEQIRGIIETVKPARSHYCFHGAGRSLGNLGLAGVAKGLPIRRATAPLNPWAFTGNLSAAALAGRFPLRRVTTPLNPLGFSRRLGAVGLAARWQVVRRTLEYVPQFSGQAQYGGALAAPVSIIRMELTA